MHKHMASRGSGGMPPRKFLNFRLFQIASGAFSGTWLEWEWPEVILGYYCFLCILRNSSQLLYLLKWSIWYKLCTYKHTAFVTHTHMHFNQYYSCCWIWDFKLNFCLKFKGDKSLLRGVSAPLCPPLNGALKVKLLKCREQDLNWLLSPAAD